MMPEISLNILDVAENSVRAEASLIEITVSVQPEEDTLTVIIKDDGCGMTPEQAASVQDPFFTTRTTRKVGLGVPFFKQAAESTGGQLPDRFRKRKRDNSKGGIRPVPYRQDAAGRYQLHCPDADRI